MRRPSGHKRKTINDELLQAALNRALEKIEMKRKLREYTKKLEKLVKEKTEKLIEAEKQAAIENIASGLNVSLNLLTGVLDP